MSDSKKEVNKGGRPTIYTKKHLELAKDYEANWSKLGDAIPMIEGLALHCGIGKNTVYDWEKLGQEEDGDRAKMLKAFSNVVTRVRLNQGRVSLNNGITGVFNPNITALVLAKHGYTKEHHIDMTTKGEALNKVSEEQLEDAKTKLIEKMRDR